MEPWVVQRCRDTSRRRVIVWASVLFAGVLILILHTRYIVNFIGGPYALPPEQMAQITDPGSTFHYFVTIRGDKLVETGVWEVTTNYRNGVKENSYTSATYYALTVGDRILIIKSNGRPGTTVEGELSTIPVDLQNRILRGARANKAQGSCLPFCLKSQGFRVRGYFGIAIGLVWIGLILGFGLPAWLRLRDISRHPVIRRIQKWGDLAAISGEVERELRAATRFHWKGQSLTDKYLVRDKYFSFNLLRLEDLLWAYKKITKRSVNFVPTGTTVEAMLFFYGGAATLAGSDRMVGEILRLASIKAPWAIIGYSKKLDRLFRWRGKTFRQTVEARRRDLLKRAA